MDDRNYCNTRSKHGMLVTGIIGMIKVNHDKYECHKILSKYINIA